MTFVFQKPGSANLVDAIGAIAKNADEGGGVFAFASRGGIEALFGIPQISQMLIRKRRLQLVVGVDAITNAEALLSISEIRDRHPQALTAYAFLHANPASTFHPKFCWFQEGAELRLIIGSGNLTSRGLGSLSSKSAAPGNWEAFAVQVLKGRDSANARKEILGWIEEQRSVGTLCHLTEERVQSRAIDNARVRYMPGPSIPERPPLPKATVVAPAHPIPEPPRLLSSSILLREIPSNRHGQADIGRAALTEFFGYEGVPKNVLIQHVSLQDTVGLATLQRLFVNKSRNYRLELSGITELEYEVASDDSRMILVATKLDGRSFRYTIVPVSYHDYARVASLLGPVPARRGRSRPMRQAYPTVGDLKLAWPAAPANLMPLELPTPEP